MRQHHRLLGTAGTLAAVLFAGGCIDVEPSGDHADDPAIAGKADAPYSQCELDAVVAYLNEPRSATDLIDAGVNRRAADPLVARRDGLDGRFGTEDDNLFDDIAEVDAVPYVGPITLDQLVTASRAVCDGEPQSRATLLGEELEPRDVELPFSAGAYRSRPGYQAIVVEASTLADLTCYEQQDLACVTLRVQLPPDARPGSYECAPDGPALVVEIGDTIFYSHDEDALCQFTITELGAAAGGKIVISDLAAVVISSEGDLLDVERSRIVTRRGPDVIGD